MSFQAKYSLPICRCVITALPSSGKKTHNNRLFYPVSLIQITGEGSLACLSASCRQRYQQIVEYVLMKVVTTKNMKLAFYSVPKVGKTTMKRRMEIVSEPDGHYHNYGDRRFSPLLRWRGRDCIRFTIIRDPIERLISAYADRVADRDDIRRSSISTFLCKLLGLNPSPGLEEFALNLKKYYLVNDRIYRHVLPQVRYIGTDPHFYDRIFALRDMDKVAEYLADKSGKEIEIKKRNASVSRFSVDDLSPEAIASLREFYKKDYQIYGNYF